MVVGRRRPRGIWTPQTPNPQVPTKTSWFQPTNDTMREQEALLASMYFLVIQGPEFGERLRCVRCNNRHAYITLNCVEKPITGLANGLYAYWRAIRDVGIEHAIPPDVAVRVKEIQRLLGMMPDFSTVHPQLARRLVKDIGPTDMQVGAVSLGILEPISRIEAQRFVDKINTVGIKPPYRLDMPNQAEIDRMKEYTGPKRTVGSRW